MLHVSSTCTIDVILFAYSQRNCFWLWTGHYSSYLFLGYFFPTLITNQTDTDLFHVSSTCVTSFVSFAFMVCWLTLNRSLFWFYCIWHCFLTRHWFVQCQQHFYIGVIMQYNSGSMNADFEQVTVSILLFFTWILRIYIILDKVCHILHVFGLNRTVFRHIVGMHLPSNSYPKCVQMLTRGRGLKNCPKIHTY